MDSEGWRSIITRSRHVAVRLELREANPGESTTRRGKPFGSPSLTCVSKRVRRCHSVPECVFIFAAVGSGEGREKRECYSFFYC